MKVFLNVNAMPFLLTSVTLALGTAFWFRIGPEQSDLTTYTKMNGKTLTIQKDKNKDDAAAQRASTIIPEANTSKDVLTHQSRPTGQSKIRSSKKKKAGRAMKRNGSAVSVAPEISTTATVNNDPSSSSDALSKYQLQVIEDRFENDASKYPMDKNAEADGIALNLLGLERLDQMFVLKVSVSNETESDFYVKDFLVQAGSSALGSRSDFRLLVEPKRTREGYVIFAKPKLGAKVRIKLKEDGGKGRAIDLPVPYLF